MLETIRAIASLGTVISVIFAIYVFYRTQEQRRVDGVYRHAGSEWMELLRFAAEHSDLDPMNTSVILGRATASSDENRRIVLHSMFATVAGRTWLTYLKQSKRIKEKRWTGWELYISNWIQRSDFQDFWTSYGKEYDADFQEYINRRLGEVGSTSSLTTGVK